jgi:beta-glucosidase
MHAPKFLLCVPLIIALMVSCQKKDSEPAYLNPDKPVEERVDDLIGRMTLKEKVGQMCQYVALNRVKAAEKGHSPEEVRNNDGIGYYEGLHSSDIEEMVKKGYIGSFLHTADAEEANYLQSLADSSRLGIPLLMGIDAIHGHAMYDPGATVFSTPIGLASSFDPQLTEEVARITASEMRHTGFHWTFSPNVDVVRDARWGRVGETFGEDPMLVKKMGQAMVRGYQGESISNPENVLACAKHYVGGGNPANGLNFAPLDASWRQLRSVYLPPFKGTLEEGLFTVMAAHNSINSVPCHANSKLLTNILRNEWGFNGFVVSDWTDVSRLHTLHNIAQTLKEADRLAVDAGLDMHMHGPGFFEEVVSLVEEGQLSEQQIDQSVQPILKAKFRLGLFEDPYVDVENASQKILTQDHKKVALESARKSIVLLKNEEMLPLDEQINSVFITGPNANNEAMLGDWTKPQPEENIITVVEGFRNHSPEGVDINYYDSGQNIRSMENKKIKQAGIRARNSDIAVVVVGSNSNRFKRHMRTCGENAARTEIDLAGKQLELLKEVHKSGTPTIVVLINGRPLGIEWIDNNIKAVIESWEPGMMGGQAICEAVFGKINPSGHLPITFPRNAGQIETFYNHKPAHFYQSYVLSETKPLYNFGHGLSYTSFEYSNLKIPETIRKGDDVEAEVDITNTGDYEGDDVVMAFVNDVYSSVTTPVKELKAFSRVSLKPGETKTVTLSIPFKELGLYNQDMEYVIETGEFEVTIDKLKGSFEVVK